MHIYNKEFIYVVMFDDDDKWRQMYTWTADTFGKPFGTDKVWIIGDQTYEFKNEEDRNLFLLKWL